MLLAKSEESETCGAEQTKHVSSAFARITMLLALSVRLELIFSSARVTTVKSQQGRVKDTWTHRLDQGYLGPIKIIHYESLLSRVK